MRRLKAWWGRVTQPAPAPTHSHPHHSSQLIWDEEAFYGMAERRYGGRHA